MLIEEGQMCPKYHKPHNAGVVHTHIEHWLCQTGPQSSFLSAPLNRAAGIADPLGKRQIFRVGSRVCARGDEKSMLVETSTNVWQELLGAIDG